MTPQPGDVVFHDGWIAVILCIAPRQRRGLCARLAYSDGSGPWIEVGRLRVFDWRGSHAWQYGD